MRRNAENAVRRPWCVLATAGMILALLTAGRAKAQGQSADQKPAESYATLYLTNLTEAREANDAVTDLRNMLPKAKIYRVESANAISIYATAEDIAMAQKILTDIDRPRRTYRLTYTISDGAQGGSQHFVMIVGSGNKTTLKQGARVPIVTGTSGTKARIRAPRCSIWTLGRTWMQRSRDTVTTCNCARRLSRQAWPRRNRMLVSRIR